MAMTKIRDKVSTILKVRIPDKGWKRTFDTLDVEGYLDQKTVKDVLIVVLEILEEYELQSERRTNQGL